MFSRTTAVLPLFSSLPETCCHCLGQLQFYEIGLELLEKNVVKSILETVSESKEAIHQLIEQVMISWAIHTCIHPVFLFYCPDAG
jgi:hypothetical protein